MKWSSKRGGTIRLLISGCLCASLCGCLPQDEITAIRFSPEGNMLAYVSEKYGLGIYDFAADISETLAPRHVSSPQLGWSHDSRRVSYVTDLAGNLDIAVVTISNEPTTVTHALSRESSPAFLADESLVFLSTLSGRQQVYRTAKGHTNPELFCELPGEILAQSASPDGNLILVTVCEELLPEYCIIRTTNRTTEKLTSTTTSVPNLESIIAWSPLSRSVLISSFDHDHTSVRAFEFKPNGSISTTDVRNVPVGLRAAVFAGEKEVVCSGKRGVVRWKIGQQANPISTSGFSARSLSANSSGTLVAAVIEDHLLASLSPHKNSPRFHFLRWEDQVVLAEKLLERGRITEAKKLYDKIATTVQTMADPALGEVVRAANLIRFNREASAIPKLETLLRTSSVPTRVSESALWRMLGFAYLRTGRNDVEVRNCLTKSLQVPDAAEDEESAELVTAVLDVISSGNNGIKLLRTALQSSDTRQWRPLLREYPTSSSLHRLYLQSREGFARLTTLFNPTGSLKEYTAQQNITFLQEFVRVARGSAEVSSARRELLRLYLENGEPAKCRILLLELFRQPDTEVIDDLMDICQGYIEVPEQQPWLEKALSDVLLHPDVRPAIETRVESSMHQRLLYLAAAKVALVKGNLAIARSELLAVDASFTDDADSSQTKPLLPLIALCFRAKLCELEGEPLQAMRHYEAALAFVHENRLNDIELYLETKFRASLLGEAHEVMTSRILSIERLSGDELLNPLWEKDSLIEGIEHWALFYKQSDGLPRQLAAYFAGIYYSSLKELPLARAAFLIAADATSPSFLREKALFELATLDETLNDPFNAARWLNEAVQLPTVGNYERDWYEYKIAENYLRLGHRTGEARDVLNRLSDSEVEWLANSAQQLLATE